VLRRYGRGGGLLENIEYFVNRKSFLEKWKGRVIKEEKGIEKRPSTRKLRSKSKTQQRYRVNSLLTKEKRDKESRGSGLNSKQVSDRFENQKIQNRYQIDSKIKRFESSQEFVISKYST